jgi:hypothetical protein
LFFDCGSTGWAKALQLANAAQIIIESKVDLILIFFYTKVGLHTDSTL